MGFVLQIVHFAEIIMFQQRNIQLNIWITWYTVFEKSTRCVRTKCVQAGTSTRPTSAWPNTRYKIPNTPTETNISGTSTRQMSSWPTFSAFSHSASSSQVCTRLLDNIAISLFTDADADADADAGPFPGLIST